MTDLVRDYEQLRAETAQMFAFDPDALTMLQTLQIDLVALLRLEIDTLQGTALAGTAPDLARLSVAVGLLQKLTPPRALEAAPPLPPSPDDAVAKLQALVGALADQANEEMITAAGLKEENDKLKAELESLRSLAAATPTPSPPTPPPTPPSTSRLATTDGAPVGPEPPKRDNNGRSASVPPHYLKSGQPREEWRDYIDGAGNIMTGGRWGPI